MPGITTQHFPFLRLPLELREAVYSHYFDPATHLIACERGTGESSYRFDFNLYLASSQIYREAQKVFQRELSFIRIEILLLETENHVAIKGNVPIVTSSKCAEQFNSYCLLVIVDSPVIEFATTFTMIILLSDLHLFCRIWYYSALRKPSLNSYLRLTLRLQNPYLTSPSEAPIRKSLQRQLLMPFGKVKGFNKVLIEGGDESVKVQLETAIEIPYDPPEKCFEDTIRLMEEGTEAFQKKGYKRALKLFIESFRAMHVFWNGRKPSIYADAHLDIRLSGGTYNGQLGTLVRLRLQIKLFAKVINVYLKLQQWKEAKFWGMRYINFMREVMRPDRGSYATDFIAPGDMALTYLRTAMACKVLKGMGVEEPAEYNEPDCGDLFQVAESYLDKKVIGRDFESNQIPVIEEISKSKYTCLCSRWAGE
ncbi:uncharacterized protein K441DRAFT_665601 [Cenococcum geophilum 1.58]|uniref:uncharacterized protein n=1 Tax=Cenococcum geophilum 1.58 TaxID=794803 RepID=UPI00358EA9F1|nr:hypothetical protein K441DRAFT_665601 [Cenococcum geophilum 1.58]